MIAGLMQQWKGYKLFIVVLSKLFNPQWEP